MKGFLGGSGISTSAKLPGVAAFTAAAIAARWGRTTGHGELPFYGDAHARLVFRRSPPAQAGVFSH